MNNPVIQGTEIENSDWRVLAKLAGTSQIERITGEAFWMLSRIRTLIRKL